MIGCCPCNCKEIGGARIGGKSWILTNHVGDGHTAILPLQEIGTGEEKEFSDVTGNEMNGTGGNGDPDSVTERVAGVGCQFSQQGTTLTQFIQMPLDTIPATQGFAISCWIKLTGQYAQNPIFSRGESFTVSTSYLNHIMATVKTETIPYSAFSAVIDQDQWYHLAVSWTPQKSLQIFLDGKLSGSCQTPIGAILEPLGADLIGKIGNGQGINGNIQDVRLHPEPRSAAWWKAEFDNYCSDFYELA